MNWHKGVLYLAGCTAAGLIIAQNTLPVAAGKTTALLRLYNPNSGEHFYTASPEEKGALFQRGWHYEGTGWISPGIGTPVYRVYNPNSGEHHFTVDEKERDGLIRAGWKNEDIAFYSGSPDQVAVYRLFNPRASNAGSHHYTTSKDEVSALVRSDWKSEGTGWYAAEKGTLLAAPQIYTPSAPSSVSTPSQNRSIRLNVPQSVQENGYYCGPASLQMVLAYHDISVSQSRLAAELNTSAVTGTEYEDLARVASRYIFGKVPASDRDPGYRAVILPAWSASSSQRADFERRACEDLANGDPVFVSINNEVTYGPGQGTVHQVVLYGVDLDASGRPVAFYYLDPSYLQQDPVYGGKKALTADELWKSMRQNPEPGYVW